ncbi:hypothetical protein [Humibacter ginsenosidimutans]|uniref:Uncharacterized protein n=1 Tax=Humibacter ginsenosidimutans TaxID=2599293 RepID=A0A5B8M681_9MICO|nr:hypothetical protein [Humibacter ginsenosidimutans]QDZ15806.1 hypothetical protein FPZ11_14455 [Humibacter ginsenosidimutans]
MSDIVNASTGELITPGAQAEVEGMLAVPPGFYGSPLGAGEIADMIDAAGELVAHIGRVVTLLYEQRHRAEETYQAKVAEYMVMHAKDGAVLARQFALFKTQQELLDLNLAKEKLRYAEEMQKAVHDRSIGLMAISKRLVQ